VQSKNVHRNETNSSGGNCMSPTEKGRKGGIRWGMGGLEGNIARQMD